MVKQIYKKNPPIEMEEFLNCKFVDLFVDIDIDRDFGMSIFVFDEDLQQKFSK